MSITYIDENKPVKEIDNNDISINDCILVRATDHFPFDRTVQTPDHAYAYSFDSSLIIGQELYNLFEEKYQHLDFVTKCKKVNEELKRYDVFYEISRQTVHFTINGLVSNHSLGSFDNSNFIILEPFKYHLDDSLKGLRVEDTYYNDDVVLSNEAVILIPKSYFEKMKMDNKILSELNNYNIVVFSENEKMAVRTVLINLGYHYYDICEHGYSFEKSDTSSRDMLLFIQKFANNNNVSQDRHFDSEINNEDRTRRHDKSMLVCIDHLKFLLDNSNFDSNIKDELLNLVILSDVDLKSYGLVQRKNNLIRELINSLGLEKLAILTKQFNETCIKDLTDQKNNNKNL